MERGTNWKDHVLNFLSVILGVSLAFFVSNQSESSKQEKAFRQNISAILEEVDADIYTLETYQIPDNKEKLSAMQEVIEMISSQSGGDSINSKIFVFFSVNNYSPSNITLNSLISSGRLDLLSDFDLKQGLLYYQSLSQELEAQGKNQVDFLLDKVTPWFIARSSFLMGEKNYIDDYSGDDSDALMIFSLYTSFVQNKVMKYEEALENAKDLRALLEEYQKD